MKIGVLRCVCGLDIRSLLAEVIRPLVFTAQHAHTLLGLLHNVRLCCCHIIHSSVQIQILSNESGHFGSFISLWFL